MALRRVRCEIEGCRGFAAENFCARCRRRHPHGGVHTTAGTVVWVCARCNEEIGAAHRRLEANLEPQQIEPGCLGGMTEVAKLLGVSKQRATQLRAMPGFPASWDRLAMGPLYLLAEVRAWNDKRIEEGKG